MVIFRNFLSELFGLVIRRTPDRVTNPNQANAQVTLIWIHGGAPGAQALAMGHCFFKGSSEYAVSSEYLRNLDENIWEMLRLWGFWKWIIGSLLFVCRSLYRFDFWSMDRIYVYHWILQLVRFNMEAENETRKTEIWWSWFGSNDFMQASLNLKITTFLRTNNHVILLKLKMVHLKMAPWNRRFHHF